MTPRGSGTGIGLTTQGIASAHRNAWRHILSRPHGGMSIGWALGLRLEWGHNAPGIAGRLPLRRLDNPRLGTYPPFLKPETIAAIRQQRTWRGRPREIPVWGGGVGLKGSENEPWAFYAFAKRIGRNGCPLSQQFQG